LPLIAATTFTVIERSVRAEAQPRSEVERCLRLQIFIRGDSTLCQEALKYAETFVERREGICIEVIDTLANKESLDRYWQAVRQFRVEKPRVPMFLACGRLKSGFTSEAKSAAGIEGLFAIHAYIRPTCQHCRDAKRYLTRLAVRWRGIRIIYHDVDQEPGALRQMNELTRHHGITAPSFPVIYVCGRVVSGYRTDATTGRQIEDLLAKASAAKSPDMNVEPPPKPRGTNGAPSQRSVALRRAWLLLPARVAAIVAYIGGWHFEAGGVPAADQEVSLPPDLPSDLPVEDGSTEEIYTPPPEAPEGIELPWIGYVRVRDLGLPAFTLLIGLIDGFNPCAMWVLVFLLSVLVNVKDRRKIAAIAGTFVIVSGLAYFAFMAAWLNVFLLVGIARPLQIALGVLAVLIGLINVKDFFAFKKGVTLSIPESVKPGIYARVRGIVTTDYLLLAIGLSVILAILVNIVELMCTAGLPAVYTQILSLQQLPPWKNYAYLGLYNVGYMFDDGLMVIVFVVTLSHRKMREAEGRWLKLISGGVVLMLGLAMLFRPDWLQW
jgi:glutaredoxin